MGGPGSPETQGGAEKKVNLGLDKVKIATIEELNSLKQMIDVENGLEGNDALMINLKTEAMRGFNEDLAEIGLTAGGDYIQEYETALDKVIMDIGIDKKIDTKEYARLEEYITNEKHFKKLEKAIAEKKVVGTINEALGTLKAWKVDIGGLANMTGESIVEGLAKLAAFLRIDSLFGISAQKDEGTIITSEVPPKVAENFETKDVTDIIAAACKTGTEGDSARAYLTSKFPKEEFGTLGFGEGVLKFKKDTEAKEVVFQFGRDNLGKPSVSSNGQQKEFNGKIDTLLPIIKSSNKPSVKPTT